MYLDLVMGSTLVVAVRVHRAYLVVVLIEGLKLNKRLVRVHEQRRATRGLVEAR